MIVLLLVQLETETIFCANPCIRSCGASPTVREDAVVILGQSSPNGRANAPL